MPEKSVYTERYALFLKLLISRRKEVKLTQQELADKLGRPQSFVSKYERGERRLDVVEFLDVAEVIGLDPNDIIRRISESKDT